MNRPINTRIPQMNFRSVGFLFRIIYLGNKRKATVASKAADMLHPDLIFIFFALKTCKLFN